MVHNILQSDLHGFKAFISSDLTIIFVPSNVTTILPKQFQHKFIFFSFADFFEILSTTCVCVCVCVYKIKNLLDFKCQV